MTLIAESYFGIPIIENEVVAENEVIVGPERAWIGLHPVTAIRLRMLDADPWERFDAIAEWRLQRALTELEERQYLRRRSLGFKLSMFELNAAFGLSRVMLAQYALRVTA